MAATATAARRHTDGRGGDAARGGAALRAEAKGKKAPEAALGGEPDETTSRRAGVNEAGIQPPHAAACRVAKRAAPKVARAAVPCRRRGGRRGAATAAAAAAAARVCGSGWPLLQPPLGTAHASHVWAGAACYLRRPAGGAPSAPVAARPVGGLVVPLDPLLRPARAPAGAQARELGEGGSEGSSAAERARVCARPSAEGGPAALRSGVVLDVAGGKGDLSWLLRNADGIDAVVVDPRRTDHSKLERTALWYSRNPAAAAEQAVGGEASEGQCLAQLALQPPYAAPGHLRCHLDAGLLAALEQSESDPAAWDSDVFWEAASARALEEEERARGHHQPPPADAAAAGARVADAARARELLTSARLVVGFHPDQATEVSAAQLRSAQACVDLALALGVPWVVCPCCVFAAEFPGRELDGQVVHSYDAFLRYLRRKHPDPRAEDGTRARRAVQLHELASLLRGALGAPRPLDAAAACGSGTLRGWTAGGVALCILSTSMRLSAPSFSYSAFLLYCFEDIRARRAVLFTLPEDLGAAAGDRQVPSKPPPVHHEVSGARVVPMERLLDPEVQVPIGIVGDKKRAGACTAVTGGAPAGEARPASGGDTLVTTYGPVGAPGASLQIRVTLFAGDPAEELRAPTPAAEDPKAKKKSKK
ncbi:unnamed protein product [Prorocentrum cordatum]|uniref:Uncharacterized protein n=1 Tax=Prorocentrum cordatum TaxID=2364126 RepID=A0ABN9S1V1_9DINO|nr:unnamed protein product [Polarella glacialis]